MESAPRERGESRIRLRLPVTVLMERHVIARRFWSLPSWRLSGVVAGEGVVHEAAAGRKLRDLEGGGELWSWSGYAVTLYKDACERYWHALVGDKPLVYVVCRDAEQGGSGEAAPLRPLVVTVDYDEATSFAETDELVLSAPIPGDLYRYMEAFVLEHYRPVKKERRKRRDWAAESDGARSGAPDGLADGLVEGAADGAAPGAVDGASRGRSGR